MTRVLLFVVALAVHSALVAGQVDEHLKPDYDRNKVPEYPGLQVFHELDELLRKDVKEDSAEANFAHLEELSDKLPRRVVKPKALIEAVRIVLAFKHAVEEHRCDALALKVWTTGQKVLAEGSKNLSRLEPLIKAHLSQIMTTCTESVEENLERAIKSIEEDGYQQLTGYVSDDFIAQWSELSKSQPDIGIEFRKMNLSLSWSRQPFNQHDLLLDQLFRVTEEHPQPVNGRELYYEKKNGDKWPKIAKQQPLKDLIRQKIITPCMGYLNKVDMNVFRLIYAAAKLNGAHWIDSFLAKRSDSFMANLFRYEFCHLEPPVIGHQLWRHYWFSTRELNIVSSSI